VSHSELRIVIGAGHYNNNPKWFHTQKKELHLLKKNDWLRRFKKDSISAILAEHVWEHLSYEEGIQAARNCYEFLKPGGYIRCAVPDGNFPNQEYQNMIQVGGPIIENHPAHSHKIVYTYQTLTTMFQTAGFKTDLLEYCDDDGKFHYRPWDPKEGMIYRSYLFDRRNDHGRLGFVSLILDAKKPLIS
jgi:predicted SAM-dependent methyltransferase